MIAPSKCQDALNQVMISSSVKIHHVQPTTDMYITCIVSSPCYMRMIKIIRTNITHNIFTINIITTATTNIVITIITIDQCCWDSAVWRRNMFDQFLTYCSKAPPWPVCILCWVKYLLSMFSFTCTQVSTLLLREDAFGSSTCYNNIHTGVWMSEVYLAASWRCIGSSTCCSACRPYIPLRPPPYMKPNLLQNMMLVYCKG